MSIEEITREMEERPELKAFMKEILRLDDYYIKVAYSYIKALCIDK